MYATLTTRLQTITLERLGAVVFLTLDRPDVRNAMNLLLIEEMRDFFLSIRGDRTIRCVVIQGAGGMFCAGADIKEMRDPTNQGDEAKYRYASSLDEMLLAVLHAPQVTIAAVEGPAIGGGLGLVTVTDVAIASEEALFALPEARLGIAPAMISPYLVERVGMSQARRLALTGRTIRGVEAYQIGLVHEVAPAGVLDSVVDEYVADILRGSPEALAATKALLFEVAGRLPEETRERRIQMLSWLRAGVDGQEGATAFVEKRKPRWVLHDDRTGV